MAKALPLMALKNGERLSLLANGHICSLIFGRRKKEKLRNPSTLTGMSTLEILRFY